MKIKRLTKLSEKDGKCIFQFCFCFLNHTIVQRSTRVSNELGAAHPQLARLALYVVLTVAVMEGLVLGLVMILIRKVWGYAYSNETEVVRYIAIMMPLLATSNFLDGLQCVLSGLHFIWWQQILLRPYT